MDQRLHIQDQREREIGAFMLREQGERIIDLATWAMHGPDTPAKARSRALVALCVAPYLDDCARLGINPEKPVGPMPAAPIERTVFPK